MWIAILIVSMGFIAAPVSAQSVPMDPADLFEVEDTEPKTPKDPPKRKRTLKFNDEAATSAFTISLILISVGGSAGTLLAQNRIDNPYMTIGLPSLASGLVVSSLVSVQAGLETESIIAGALAVLLNTALPVIIGMTL